MKIRFKIKKTLKLLGQILMILLVFQVSCFGQNLDASGLALMANTEVETSSGEVMLKDIHAGDHVLSVPDKSGVNGEHVRPSFQKVIAIFRGKIKNPIEIIFLDKQDRQSKFIVSPQKQIYINGKGFVNAKNLNVGDQLVSQDHRLFKITSLKKMRDQSIEGYGITVAQNHTFFVGDQGVLVHNGGGCSGGEADARGVRQGIRRERDARQGVHLDAAQNQNPLAGPVGQSNGGLVRNPLLDVPRVDFSLGLSPEQNISDRGASVVNQTQAVAEQVRNQAVSERVVSQERSEQIPHERVSAEQLSNQALARRQIASKQVASEKGRDRRIRKWLYGVPIPVEDDGAATSGGGPNR